MDNTEFIEIAEDTLQKIFEAIEEADQEYLLEMDFMDGMLDIELPDGRKYIINRHNSSQQIWVSSPISGASHFSYEEDEEIWKDSADNDINEFLTQELKQVAGLNIKKYLEV